MLRKINENVFSIIDMQLTEFVYYNINMLVEIML